MAAEVGCEVAHVELRGGRLRVILDHAEAVTLAHCEAVSHQLSAALDRDDYGERSYVLEVSSPGLDRQLYRPADYRRFAGRRARVTFREGPERKKKTLVGALATLHEAGDEKMVEIATESGDRVRIPLHDIEVARLEIEL